MWGRWPLQSARVAGPPADLGGCRQARPEMRSPSTLPGVYLVSCRYREATVLPGHREGQCARGDVGRRESSARWYRGAAGLKT